MPKVEKKFLLVYKTATTPFFPSVLTVVCNTGRFPKLMGGRLKPKQMLAIINHGVANWFFSQDVKETAEAIFAKIYASSTLLKTIRKKEKEIFKKLSQAIKLRPAQLFSQGILTKAGEEKLRKIFALYMDYGEYVDAPGFLFQVFLTNNFRLEVFRLLKGRQDKEEIFNYLLSHYKLTNYEKFLFALMKTMKPRGNKRQLIKAIMAKYFWLVHDYLGEIVDEQYIQKKLRELRADRGQLIEQYQKVRARLAAIKKIKKDLPVALLKKVEAIQEILYLYSERKKEILNQVNIFIRQVFEYKLPRLSVSRLRRLFQMTPEEIIKYLKNEDIPDLNQRHESWVYLIENGQIAKGHDKYFNLIISHNANGNLKGLAAAPGKVKGRVSLILNVSQISRFKKGNILVAPYTNVSYLPIMHQAKAILTEAGGLTSHAAIVARELGKPSIVGIKGLLANLKDGDLVEVDAGRGIVKILK